VKRGRVYQGGADAEGTIFHGLPHELLHAVQLLGSRRAVSVTQLVDPDCSRADEGGDVTGNAAVDQIIKVFSEGGPFDGVFDVALLFEGFLFHLVVERAHRTAFAEYLQGHTLANS